MQFDVAIVGASSAGLYAAWLLGRAGKRVAVFERRMALKPARRTLIVTPEFSRSLGPFSDDIVLHRTSRMAVASPGAETEIRLRKPDIIVDRKALAHALEAKAREAGAEVYYGHKFSSLDANADGLILRMQDAGGKDVSVVAGALIGADGMLSAVAKAAGIPRPPTRPIVQAEVDLPPGWDPEVTKVWFDARATRFFYWLIPDSERTGVAGLVGDGRDNTLNLLRDFLVSMGLEPRAFQGARVAMHHPSLKPWASLQGWPVYLIGDAAGQVKVTTVGGTVTGFAGARAAVEALTQGIPYRKALRPLKRELDLQWGLRLLLDHLDNRGYNRLIRAITPRVRDLLAEHNRDRFAPVFWRLFLEPRLLAVGLLCLMGMPKRAVVGWRGRVKQRGMRGRQAAGGD
jgi:flavin-dependent dehydrogenase